LDEIKKDLTHRDVFLCGEIDKLNNYTQEDFEKIKEKFKGELENKASIN